MVTTLFADTTPLLDALAAADEGAALRELLVLLRTRNVSPMRVAGRVGLAALWGGAAPVDLALLGAAGRLAEWQRALPFTSENESDARRELAPTLPLLQGFLAVAPSLRAGLAEPHPALPDPLEPAQVGHAEGPLGAMREAVAQRDVVRAQRILLGYHATGADYREFLTTLYAALATRYPTGGTPLTRAYDAARILDMADWGGNMPAFIAWYPQHMMADAPDAPAGVAAREVAAAPDFDLRWLRTRLSTAREEAAGSTMQQALATTDPRAACAAVLTALRSGATPRGVMSGIALVLAHRIALIAEGDRAALLAAGAVLRYVHAVHDALRRTQDPNTWPLLYTAACAVAAVPVERSASALEAAASGPSSALMSGGFMPAAMLRVVEERLSSGEAAAALATARRYVQMGQPPRALAATLCTMVASADVLPGDAEGGALLSLVTAACEEYLLVPPALANSGQNPLLTAAVRLAAELRGTRTGRADRVRVAVEASVARNGATH